MANELARIFGTEEDKVNCPFYFKIGACRHGDRCSRLHIKPLFSTTLLIPHLYQMPPPGPDGNPINDEEKFEEFWEEMYDELSTHGGVEELHVCDNLGEHMIGNVYVKFSSEEEAESALKALNGRFYAGRLVVPEYSPVSDFREARCRQFDENTCGRGAYCNFMHLKRIPRHLRSMLKRRSRSRTPPRRGRREDRREDKRDDRRDDRREDRRDDRRDDRRSDRYRDRYRRDDRDSDRRPRDRDYSRRSRDRERSIRDSRSGRDRERESSAERRAKIQQWNREREEQRASAVQQPAPQAASAAEP